MGRIGIGQFKAVIAGSLGKGKDTYIDVQELGGDVLKGRTVAKDVSPENARYVRASLFNALADSGVRTESATMQEIRARLGIDDYGKDSVGAKPLTDRDVSQIIQDAEKERVGSEAIATMRKNQSGEEGNAQPLFEPGTPRGRIFEFAKEIFAGVDAEVAAARDPNAPAPKEGDVAPQKTQAAVDQSHFADALQLLDDGGQKRMDNLVKALNESKPLAGGDMTAWRKEVQQKLEDAMIAEFHRGRGEDARAERNGIITDLLSVFPEVKREALAPLDVADLRRLAAAVADERIESAEELLMAADSMTPINNVNTNDMMDMVERLKTDKAFAGTVTFKNPEKFTSTMKGLLADIFFDSDTVGLDMAATPEHALLKTLQKHQDSLVFLGSAILNGEDSKTMLMLRGQIPPAAQVALSKVIDLVKQQFGLTDDKKADLGDIWFKDVREAEENKKTAKQLIADKLVAAEKDLNDGKPSKLLKDLGAAFGKISKEECARMQKMMTTAFDAVIAKKKVSVDGLIDHETANVINQMAEKAGKKKVLDIKEPHPLNPNSAVGAGEPAIDLTRDPENMSPAELELLRKEQPEKYEAYEIKKIENSSLNDLIGSGALDPISGHGKYLKQLMSRYFAEGDEQDSKVAEMDQRAMFASLVRNSKPLISVGDSDELAAETLGAFFKGAGPVMQKTLQELSSINDMPQVFKDALKDMRSRLQPLPEPMIHALLADLVERSNGQIRGIEVVKSLGAASVAQSILCNLTDAAGKSHEVVVKLIRPDAENRAQREAALCRDVANGIPGMRASIDGQLERIMEEFDLTVEKQNAAAGHVYDKEGTLHDRDDNMKVVGTEAFSDVHSVKVDKLSPKARSTMIMERAPGNTIDKFLEDVAKRTEQVRKAHMEKGKLIGATDAERQQHLWQLLEELRALHEEILDVQTKSTHFAHQWVMEGIYGGGFFHGDAHAGNIMVDKNKGLTVIDYGNATKLTGSQQNAVVQIIAACMTKDTGAYMKAFRTLLSKGGAADFDRLQDKVRARIQAILKKGDDKNVGELISASLVALQKLGVEVPGPVFNFSACQIRLQGTIDQINSALKSVDKGMQDALSDIRANGLKSGESYSYDADILLPEDLARFLKEFDQGGDSLTLRDLEIFEQKLTDFCKYTPSIKPVFDTFVGSPGYVQRKQVLNQEELRSISEDANEWENKNYEDADMGDRLEELLKAQENLENAENQGAGKDQIASLMREVVKFKLVVARNETKLNEARDSLNNSVDKGVQDAARKLIANAKLIEECIAFGQTVEESLKPSSDGDELEKDRIKRDYKRDKATFNEAFARERVKVLDTLRQYDATSKKKHMWEKGGRSFLTVMGNALYDNKVKTAWKLGVFSAIKVAKST